MRSLLPILDMIAFLAALVACGAPAGSRAAVAERKEVGIASWYGGAHDGRRTANGETFDSRLFTAAHRRLPFGSLVRVTNLSNGASVVVRINDRGPYVKGRLIDLSRRAARDLGFEAKGLARVVIEMAGK